MAAGRGLKAVVAGTFLCAAVTGCTSTGSPEGAQEPSPTVSASPTERPEPVSLTLGVYGPEGSLDVYDEMATAFTEERPRVEVSVERFQDAAAVATAVQSGDAPDVFLMDHEHLPELVQEERVQPVDALLEARQIDFGDGFQRGGLTAFAADAALQCMPHDVSPLVVYYNQDLVKLERLGTELEEPPNAIDGWSWEMFTEAARQASRGPASGVYIEPSLKSLAPFVWSAGGDIVDDVQAPTTLTLSESDSREALEQLLALVRDPQVTPAGRDLDKDDAVSRFKRGRLAMFLGTRALTPVFREAEALRFDVMPLPSMGRLRTVADMTGYCISAQTDSLEAAADLLAFAVGREGASIVTRAGYIVPSNLEVANSPVFAQQARPPQSSFLFNESVRRAQSMPFVPEWQDLTERVQPSLDRMFYAPVIDLDAMLERIDTQSTRVLAPDES